MSTDLIFDICEYHKVNEKKLTLLNKIEENIQKYKNLDVNSIDTNYHWVSVSRSYYGMKNNIYFNDYYLFYKYFTCLKTNNVGLSFEYNNCIIKPILAIKHNWKLKSANSVNSFYKCENCNSIGIKDNSIKFSNFILNIHTGDIHLSCNQLIVKNLIN